MSLVRVIMPPLGQSNRIWLNLYGRVGILVSSYKPKLRLFRLTNPEVSRATGEIKRFEIL